jgi:hypothetical protein
VSTAAQLARFGASVERYFPFLSFSRYGSHVAQTLLALTLEYLSGAREIEAVEDCGVPDAEEDIAAIVAGAVDGPAESGDAPVRHTVTSGPGAEPDAVRRALRSFVLGALSSILPHVHAALYNEAGTHVVRSFICVLSGVPPALAGAGGGGLSKPSKEAGKEVGKGTPGPEAEDKAREKEAEECAGSTSKHAGRSDGPLVARSCRPRQALRRAERGRATFTPRARRPAQRRARGRG